MKAFFKENDKIIINSMDYTEALVGKQFLQDLSGKALYAEQRNDINDDFDGLVLTIGGTPSAGDLQVTPSTEPQEITAPEGLGFARVIVDPVTNEIDANIVPENIVKGVTILGVEGNAVFTIDGHGFFYSVAGAVSDEEALLAGPGVANWEIWIGAANNIPDESLLLTSDNYSLRYELNAVDEHSVEAVNEAGIVYTVEVVVDPQTEEKSLVITTEE